MSEHIYFEFCNQPKTIISREFPQKWKPNKERYYPINNKENNDLYEKYKALASQNRKILFGGRLAEYKYYDMDDVIEKAMALFRTSNQ